MPSLLLYPGTKQEQSVPLDKPTISLGRDPNSDVPLDLQSTASRHHAQIYEVAGEWRIRDLNSANGTFVNGRRIDDCVLEAGANLHLGDFPLKFHQGTAGTKQAGSITQDSEDFANNERRLEMSARARLIQTEIAKVIIGQKEIVRDLVIALLARGHALMIGLPGLAKTTLIRTLAEVLDLKFRRIQFTPDLMPSDITGTDLLEVDEISGKKEFRFLKGPIFTNILLADEINRTPPKTQAALLEAMQEYNVTAAGQTFRLDPPFFVLATQNPLEQEGTYPLPEAQLDRFMFSIHVDYPSEAEEELIAKLTTQDTIVEIGRVLTAAEILELQSVVRKLPVSDHVIRYATRLVRATRPGDPRAPDFIKRWIHCGAGPRAVQYLILAAKASAVLEGRILVSAEDIKRAAKPVLRHRLFTTFAADSEGIDTGKMVDKLLQTVPEPGEKDY